MSEQMSDADMLEATQDGMEVEPEMMVGEVEEGAKFLVVDLYNFDPDYLKEAPTTEQLAKDGEFWDPEGGCPRPVIEIKEGEKYFFWNPRDAHYELGGRELLLSLFGTYAHPDKDFSEDEDEPEDDSDDEE